MLVHNGKEVFKGLSRATIEARSAVKRNRHGDIVYIDPVFRDCQEIHVPAPVRKTFGFSLEARCNWRQ